jgi:hypothetical protein
LEVTNVTVGRGTWDDKTNSWTVSLPRGAGADLHVSIKNNTGELVTIYGYCSNENPTPGVMLRWVFDSIHIPKGDISTMMLTLDVSADADSGTLPEVQLEIRQQ